MIISLALLIAEERGEVPDGGLLKAKVQNTKRLAKFKGIECNLHGIVSEIIIGRVLIRLGIIQNFITIYREFSCEPRRELLIEVKKLTHVS